MTQKHEAQKDRYVIEEFQRRYKKIMLLIVFLVPTGMIAAGAIYFNIAPKLIGTSFVIACFIYALLINLKLWRCPACNGHLGKLYIGLKFPKYCPNCGILLIED